MPFQFLEKVKTVFAQKFAGSINEGSVNAHSLDRTFGPTLKKEMEETMAMEQLSGGGGGGVGGAQTGSNTYLVVADDDCGRQMPFQFLEKVKTVFAQKFAGSINEGSVNAHSLDRTFGPTLKKEMEETMAMEQLSGGGGGGVGGAQTGSNKVASVQQQVSEVKEIMMDNIEKVLDRGEKIEVLVDKTEALRFQADNFHKQGRALRNRMWWNNLKMKLILLVFVIGVGIIIFCVFCFGGEKNCTAKKKSSGQETARRLARRLLLGLVVAGVGVGDGVDVEMENNGAGAFLLEN